MSHEAVVLAVAGGAMRSSVRRVRQLHGGISNRTYLVDLEAPASPRRIIVRLFADRARARTEGAALRMLEGSEVPAPSFLGQGKAQGAGWFVVSTREPGRPAARPDDPEWLARLAAALAAIHHAPRRGRGLRVDRGPERAWIDDEPPAESGRMAEALWRTLQRRRGDLGIGPTVLVHGDFHAGNVHWLGDRLVGVIDWEMARWGPPAADVAYAYMDLALAAGRRTAERFLAAYVDRAGPVRGFRRLAARCDPATSSRSRSLAPVVRGSGLHRIDGDAPSAAPRFARSRSALDEIVHRGGHPLPRARRGRRLRELAAQVS